MTINRTTDLSIIDDSCGYVGYVWKSNAQVPERYFEQTELNLKQLLEEADFPFIIEGNFYAAAENISIRIQYLDGQYYVTKFDLTGIDITNFVQEYYGHDLEGRNFKMLEYWEVEQEKYPELEGMETLVPSWSAFIGFAEVQLENN